MRPQLNTDIFGSYVYLRPAVQKDAALIRKWHNDPELIRQARIGEKKTTLKQEKRDIEIARKSDDQAYHIIITKANNKCIGFLRLNFIDRSSGNVWLRMMIGDKKSQGKGYAYDALKCYLKWIFETLNMHRITLECYSTNKRALKFYQSIGFNKEGTLREAVFIDGKYHDIISFGILEKDLKK